MDSNDSGDISFTEFSIWLVHRLGPQLMQKISESVQQVMSNQDKAAAAPQSTNSPRISQATSSTSPPEHKVDDHPPNFLFTPPRSEHSADTLGGRDASQTSSYFGLQVKLSIAHRDALVETDTCLCCSCFFSHSYSQIGINYTGSAAPLAGCVNDIRGWADLFRSVGCSFNVHIVCRQVPQRCFEKHNLFVMFLCSDEDSRISGTEKQRGAKKSDILSAMQDIRGAMIASVATHK